MQLIVSNYGLRLLQHLRGEGGADAIAAHPRGPRLLALRAATSARYRGEPWQCELVAEGLAQCAGDGATEGEIELRYRRNPLEHVERVVFEYTRVCNLDCAHCRNGHLEPAAEARPARLAEAVDRFAAVGIKRFDFVGGEVTLYGAGWLGVVERARAHPGAVACVVTNGWFLGERDFKAAGARFEGDRDYLAALARAGLTHVIFSLDGPAEAHDRLRGVPGLYGRVVEGFARVRAAGLAPQVSLLVGAVADRAATLRWLADVADALYGPREVGGARGAERLVRDPMNYVSNLVDVGNAVRLRRHRDDRPPIADDDLRCKNFFRPRPSVRIQATGELSLCPLAEGGEGYGNVHERGLLDVLNGMQDAFAYRLHAEGRIASYRRFLDPAVFGARFDHACALRTALAMIARRLEERGVDENDAEAIRAVNVEVARKVGALPPLGKTANGTRLPY
jgi:MoaA/NifB/PqqE/SkfB family radical SAM enzyme